MRKLNRALEAQAKDRPAANLQDYMKLIYQSEFGCGHLISDAESAKEYLLSEWTGAESDPGQLLIEKIGNGFSRVNISRAKEENIPINIYLKAFLLSAQEARGAAEGFVRKADLVKALCARADVPFTPEDVENYIADWRAKGRPLFRHSAEYRAAYRPAYRVMLNRYARLLHLARDAAQSKKPLVIAIDGRCGAGKTTLAHDLSELLGAPVVHMDDFFLPPALRTQARLTEPGGNIHYERFLEEAADDITAGREIRYRKFDCSRMDYGQTIALPAAELTIVEGSYSLHPKLQYIYGLRVFCDADRETQKARLTAREGEDGYQRFLERWIPMEEKYFRAFGIKEQCGYVFMAE